MAAEGVATQGAKESADVVLTKVPQNIPVSAPQGLNIKILSCSQHDDIDLIFKNLEMRGSLKNLEMQGSFCICAQPMRDDIIM